MSVSVDSHAEPDRHERVDSELLADPARSARLLAECRARGLTLATAESLTGGRLVASLIDIPGASDVVLGGICAYAFSAKHALLGLDLDELEAHGAVRPEVAEAMAIGAQRAYGADLAISTTGVAGPGPDAFGAPEGAAFVTVRLGEHARTLELHERGTRDEIRTRVVIAAVDAALTALSSAG